MLCVYVKQDGRDIREQHLRRSRSRQLDYSSQRVLFADTVPGWLVCCAAAAAAAAAALAALLVRDATAFFGGGIACVADKLSNMMTTSKRAI